MNRIRRRSSHVPSNSRLTSIVEFVEFSRRRRLFMRVYRYVMAFFAGLAGLWLATGIAPAARLVMVSLQGSTDGGLTFSNSITASAGSVISYRVIAQIAAIGTTNGTKTIATRTDHPTASTANYDGINSLGFNLSTGSIGAFKTGTLFTGTSSPGAAAT